GFDQIQKAVLPFTIADTEVTDVYTGKDDFFYARRRDLLCLPDNIFYFTRSAGAPGQRDRAKRTRIVAAILDLQEGSRAVSDGVGRHELVRLVYRRIMNNSLPTLRQIVDMFDDVKLFRRSQHHVYPWYIRDLLRLQLCVTSYNRYIGIRRVLQRFFYHLTALLVRMISYRTGIDNIYICPTVKRGSFITCILENPAYRRGF